MQFRGLITRLRARLAGARPEARRGIGEAFGPAMAADWNELVEQVDAEVKKCGSALVGSWEVGAAELGRVLVGDPDDRRLVERYSDALVPTQGPLTELHRAVPAAMARGLKAGTTTGRLDAATAPLGQLVQPVGGQIEAGWEKTRAYLEPLFARGGDPHGASARFAQGGPALAAASAEAADLLRARLLALPEAPNLWDGLTGAVEDWQRALSRSIEIIVVGRAKAFVADVSRR